MRVPITMANLGYDMETGKIVYWSKAAGDRVEPGEVIAEVETDKTNVEMESLASGTSSRSSRPPAPTFRSVRPSASSRPTTDGARHRARDRHTDARGDRSPDAGKQAGGAALLRLRGAADGGGARAGRGTGERDRAAPARACALALRHPRLCARRGGRGTVPRQPARVARSAGRLEGSGA